MDGGGGGGGGTAVAAGGHQVEPCIIFTYRVTKVFKQEECEYNKQTPTAVIAPLPLFELI